MKAVLGHFDKPIHKAKDLGPPDTQSQDFCQHYTRNEGRDTPPKLAKNCQLQGSMFFNSDNGAPEHNIPQISQPYDNMGLTVASNQGTMTFTDSSSITTNAAGDERHGVFHCPILRNLLAACKAFPEFSWCHEVFHVAQGPYVFWCCNILLLLLLVPLRGF